MVKDWIPISHDNYKQVQGPFYHGTKANLAIGDLLTTGFISHFEDGRILKHLAFQNLGWPRAAHKCWTVGGTLSPIAAPVLLSSVRFIAPYTRQVGHVTMPSSRRL